MSQSRISETNPSLKALDAGRSVRRIGILNDYVRVPYANGSSFASQLLYREFTAYYTQERCHWAPSNPKRAFNLAFKTLYPAYCERMAPSLFLSFIYDTLGVRGGEPRGLFQTFDPEKYKG